MQTAKIDLIAQMLFVIVKDKEGKKV